MGSELRSGFDCRVCGRHHEVLPLSYSVKAPVAAAAVPPDEVERRVVITADQCVIDDRFYYVRGRFAVPVHGLDEPFIWGVWARLRPEDFYQTNRLWTDPERIDEPAYPGLLNSELPLYGETLNLPVHVITQPVAAASAPHCRGPATPAGGRAARGDFDGARDRDCGGHAASRFVRVAVACLSARHPERNVAECSRRTCFLWPPCHFEGKQLLRLRVRAALRMTK